MRRLTWVQPEDLLTHELVAAAEEGKRVDDVRLSWTSAGGDPAAPVSGASATPADEKLRALAAELLDELDRRPADPATAATEPTELADVRAAWGAPQRVDVTGDHAAALPDRLRGAWLGRAAGCLLGKPVEKIPREGIRAIAQATGSWPVDDWFTARGLPDDVARAWPWNRRSAANSLQENIRGMPEDDDLNFAMIALRLVEEHGHGFTTDDVAQAWLDQLPGGRVFTAERVAYRNLLLGELPPRTAVVRNPFREWIGAAIRADVHGWTHPGDPAAAAEAAWRDARLSHTRSGVHAAMWCAALCSLAVVHDDVDAVLDGARAVLPQGSRYGEAVRLGTEVGRRDDLALEGALDVLHDAYGHLHWVHAVNNGALTAMALARGRGELGPSIGAAVTGGWDTDSVGATVGSVCGALRGAAALPSRWTDPLHDRVASTVPGFDGIALSELARRTLAVAAS